LKEFKTSQYDVFYAAWKQHYDAILKAAPQARIEGPSTNKYAYALNLAREMNSCWGGGAKDASET
jgi:hypothetical protein